jgi:hypothetical protein
MKNTLFSYLMVLAMLSIVSMSSCKKDEPTPTPTPSVNGFTIGSTKYPVSKGWILPIDTGYFFVLVGSNTISDTLTGRGNLWSGMFSAASGSLTLSTGSYAFNDSNDPMSCDDLSFWLNYDLMNDTTEPQYLASSLWNANKSISVAKESNNYIITFSGITAKDANAADHTASANIKVPLMVLDGFFGVLKPSQLGLSESQYRNLSQKLRRFKQN